MPTRFSLRPAEALGDGRWRVIADFEIEQWIPTAPEIRWSDAMLIKKENGQYRIDDIVYNPGDGARGDAAHLLGEFDGCAGPKWIGG